MKHYSFFILFLCFFISKHSYTQIGSLDPSFNNDGRVITQLSNFSDIASASVLQNDGRLLLAGNVTSDTSLNNKTGVVRYMTDGSLDLTFGNNGVVVFDVTNDYEIITGIEVQSDGKILVSGYARLNNTFQFAVARLNADGSLDTTFNLDGIANTTIRGILDAAHSIVLQTDGKILVAGSSGGPDGLNDMVIVRYTSTGLLDTSFFGTGKRILSFDSLNNELYCMKIQADGKIVVAGYVTNNPIMYSNKIAVVRLLPNGEMDSSFFNTGYRTFSIATNDIAYDLAIQNDGKIVLTGYSELIYPDIQMFVVRLNTDGTFDSSFATNGIYLKNITSDYEEARNICLQTDGKIIVSGYRNTLTLSSHDFAAFRLNINGSLDTTFGIGGVIITDFEGLNDEAYDAEIQADGKLILAGTASSTINSFFKFAAARYLMDLNIGLIAFTEQNQLNYDVYPNPMQNRSTMTYELQKDELVQISLRDLQGQMIQILVPQTLQKTGLIEQELILPSDLSSGYYLLMIETPNGAHSIKVMIGK